MRQEFPILEFDPVFEGIIKPGSSIKPVESPEHCVICFFQEVIDHLHQEGRTKVLACSRWEDRERILYEIDLEGKRLAVFHPGVGAPLAAATLEEIIALGGRKFIACGGAGVLDRSIAAGHILVPSAAVRDEGTSYHYLPPSREVSAHPLGITAIEKVLRGHNIDYILTKSWTTDAPYRETPAKVKLRQSEGCLAVEMESAAFFAVAQFRGVVFAQMLYGGDDVSGEEWDFRNWNELTSVREKLFWLAAEACLAL